MENADQLIFNGLDETGAYLLPSMTTLEMADLSYRVRIDQAMDVPFGVDRHDLGEAGWAAIFHRDGDPEIQFALKSLLKHRKEEAGDLYRELTYEPGESKAQFLARYKVGPGSLKVDRIPYYLLIVGGPEEIPFSFQYQLDVQYAVGRISFDHSAEYEAYADSVKKAENRGSPRPKQVKFWGVKNTDDTATQQSTDLLVKPLIGSLSDRLTDWDVQASLEEDATKNNLTRSLGGGDTPALLFTASHGLSLGNGHPLQEARQGALVGAEWPGPEVWKGGVMPDDFFFAAEDVPAAADLHGLISFHYACYGAGTPWVDAFSFRKPKEKPKRIAPKSFVAPLPKRLLGHPGGGALAVIGHVERAWGWSFLWEGGAGSQPQTFQDTLDRLLAGWRVGAAMEPMNRRYAELSTDFAELLTEEILELDASPPKSHRPPPRPTHRRPRTEEELRQRGRLWTARNDARSYIVLGDPAVRLCVPNQEPNQDRN